MCIDLSCRVVMRERQRNICKMKWKKSLIGFRFLLDLGEVQASCYFCSFQLWHAFLGSFLSHHQGLILPSFTGKSKCHPWKLCHSLPYKKLTLHSILGENKKFQAQIYKGCSSRGSEVSVPITQPWAAPECRSACSGVVSFRKAVHQSSLVLPISSGCCPKRA